MGYYSLHNEIIEAISDYYKDDMGFVAEIFEYLYDKTGEYAYFDAKVEICTECNLCTECFRKLEPRERVERHGNNYTFDEHRVEMCCPVGCEQRVN